MIYPVGKLYWKFSIEFSFGFLLTIHGGNFLTLGAHAHSEGYSSCRVCMCVCVCVCVYV